MGDLLSYLDNLLTLFITKTAKNPTLWGRTYLYSPYKGVPPGTLP